MSSVVEVSDLHKHYGDTHAVDGISFSVQAGEVFALLGPNGAGKSTTVEILEGHRRPSSGAVSVLGYDPAADDRDFRDRIGIVLQSSGIERELTVTEVIDLYRAPYRRPLATREVIDLVGLNEKADARIKTLSGGQQRRIDLALGLVGDPDLVFLDEPTTGFDPAARRQSWELIDRLRDRGTTVLLTTHYMDEAEHLADRLAVIAHGRFVAEGTPSSIGGSLVDRTVVSFRLPAGADAAALPAGIGEYRNLGQRTELVTDETTRALHVLTGWALDSGYDLDGIGVHRPTLEDVYLELVGEHAS